MLYNKRPLIYIPGKRKKASGGGHTPPTPIVLNSNVLQRQHLRFKDNHVIQLDLSLNRVPDTNVMVESNPTINLIGTPHGNLTFFLLYGFGNDIATYVTNTIWEGDDYDSYINSLLQNNLLVIDQSGTDVYRVVNRASNKYQFNVTWLNHTYTLPDNTTVTMKMQKATQSNLPDVINQISSQYGSTPYALIFPMGTSGHFPMSTADILTVINEIVIPRIQTATITPKTAVVDYQFQ